MSNRVNKYLFDMKIAMESINEFVTDIDWEEFKTSKMIRSAVERQLEIVGESVKRIERTGEIVPIENARQIVGFHNILGVQSHSVAGFVFSYPIVNKQLTEIVLFFTAKKEGDSTLKTKTP